MKYFFNLLCLLFVQKWDAFDRFLCWNLPWPLRFTWRALWIRADEFHPSLSYDGMGLLKKILFWRRWHKFWMNATRLRPIPKEAEKQVESLKLLNLEKRLRDEYSLDLVRRRDIAHRRDEKTPSAS